MNHNPIEAAYGLTHMSLEQEIAAPEREKPTRQCKVRNVDNLGAIRRWLDGGEGRARRIPEDNDEEHAALVRDLADRIHKARIVLEMSW